MSLPPEGYLLLGILVLDVMFGDAVYALHPVRLIGQSCEKFENLLRSLKLSGHMGGIILLYCLLYGLFLFGQLYITCSKVFMEFLGFYGSCILVGVLLLERIFMIMPEGSGFRSSKRILKNVG